ncbi:MAG: DUF349 domain-containing protein [Bacteroidales bacterium]|nr:DUF349 domain-containing protein [Bacteroidales bacterium]
MEDKERSNQIPKNANVAKKEENPVPEVISGNEPQGNIIIKEEPTENSVSEENIIMETKEKPNDSNEKPDQENESVNKDEKVMEIEKPKDPISETSKIEIEEPEQKPEIEKLEETPATVTEEKATEKLASEGKEDDVTEAEKAEISVDDSEEKPDQEIVSENKDIENVEVQPEAVDKTETQVSEKASDTEHEKHKEAAKEPINENYDSFTKEELIEKLGEIVQEDDVSSIKTIVTLIKVTYYKKQKEGEEKKYKDFLSQGGIKEDYVPEENLLDKQFAEIFDIYKKNRAKFRKEQENNKVENLEKKKNILEELKELINSDETLKKTYDDFKLLQEKWKGIGMVPAGEVSNLWQNYHFLVERFFDKVKINNELKDLDLKKNLESKIVLCEKAEELLLENSVLKSFKQLQKYHEKWKEIGPIPQDKKDEIWERFKTTTNKINEIRREYYSKLQDQQIVNHETKIALCEKAEEILSKENISVKDWQKRTNEINELLKVWKTIGRAPRKLNDEIWDRFKAYLDAFFGAKKEYFTKLKQEQIDNYNQKLDLCAQAEALSESSDWKNTTLDLINLQRKWKEIGPVSRKNSDKIWKRFRSTCDKFFDRKSEYFKNIHSNEADNLKLKLDLIKKIEEYQFSDNKNENLEIIKGFQREWTEIGHIPIKEKDKVQNSFRDTINKHLDALKINSLEISTLNFKSKFDTIKSSPDANRLIYQERNFISNKIDKLREEINLWENNIGFLANSKKASLLKEEFKKKIEKAKKDLLVLEEKFKIVKEY